MSDGKPYDDDMDLVARTMRAAPGNVPAHVKDVVATWWSDNSQGQGFARAVCARLETTHVELFGNPEVPRKQEGRIIFETDVTRGTCHALLNGRPMLTLAQTCATTSARCTAGARRS